MSFPSLAPKIGRLYFENRPGSPIDLDRFYDVQTSRGGFARTSRAGRPSLEAHGSSRISFRQPADPMPATPEQAAPNGGLLAWAQVLAAFLLVANGFGYINAFGVFQKTYAETLGRDPSSISFVGSFQIFLLFFVGSLSGRALDAGYFRSLLVAGCSLQILGIFATASALEFWQLVLAQGIVQGIGNGMLFTPLVWLVSTYFSTRRGLALGISSCGAPIGGTLFTLIAQQLLPKVGLAWTVRCMGFLVTLNSAVILLLARSRAVKRIKAPFLELGAFRDKPYLYYCIGIFFALLGLYWAPFYITVFVETNLDASDSTSFVALMVLNAVGVTGRLVPPAFADRHHGPLRTLTLCTFLSAIFIYWWIAVESITGALVWCAFYAFWSNAVQTLFTASIGTLTKDHSKLGVRIGMAFTTISVAALTGPPIAGALIRSKDGDFTYAQLFGATSMMVGAGFMAGACVLQLQP